MHDAVFFFSKILSLTVETVIYGQNSNSNNSKPPLLDY